jgi:hypothetical protein
MPLVRNPILPGFNADPSIVRVGEDGEYHADYIEIIVLTSRCMYNSDQHRGRHRSRCRALSFIRLRLVALQLAACRVIWDMFVLTCEL